MRPSRRFRVFRSTTADADGRLLACRRAARSHARSLLPTYRGRAPVTGLSSRDARPWHAAFMVSSPMPATCPAMASRSFPTHGARVFAKYRRLRLALDAFSPASRERRRACADLTRGTFRRRGPRTDLMDAFCRAIHACPAVRRRFPRFTTVRRCGARPAHRVLDAVTRPRSPDAAARDGRIVAHCAGGARCRCRARIASGPTTAQSCASFGAAPAPLWACGNDARRAPWAAGDDKRLRLPYPRACPR